MTLDLRTLDLPGFRRWLDLQLARWQADPVFIQRTRIRDLRRAHPEVRRLEREYDHARDADTATPEAGRLRMLDRRLHAISRAIAGLTDAMTGASAERQPGLLAKREAFRARQRTLMAERDSLVQRSPMRQELAAVAERLERLRTSIGLTREQAHLADLVKARGRRSGQAGSAFEQEALAMIRERVVPDVAASETGLQVLRRVRLGAAGVELDFAIVRRDHADDPVDVRGLVEVKRNINDLAHGFQRRQTDLNWLTGAVGHYDPAAFRTGHFRAGHFDRPAVHWEDDRPYVFAPGSFRRFTQDASSGYFLDGLHLLTRAGPIWGASSAAMNRIAARIATDEEWDPANEAFLLRLFDWCRSLTGPVETPDVLRLLTATGERMRHLWLSAPATDYSSLL